MQKISLSDVAVNQVDGFSEEFIHNSVVNLLKENGYKVHKDIPQKESKRAGRTITASKFFRKEVIEIKSFPYYYHSVTDESTAAKSTHAKSWFFESLFNFLLNLDLSDNAEVAMALPNVGRYQAIISKLGEYFFINDLYFRIYLVNDDGSVEVSNLNSKYAKSEI